jgi:nitroreductase
MEFKEVIDKRRTIRDFQNREVPIRIVEYAIANGFKAPTYNHLRAWDFIVINNPETKQLLIETENIEKEIDTKTLEMQFENQDTILKEMYLEAIPKQKRMILNAPTVIVVVFKPKTKVADAMKIYDLNCLSSVWTCIENFLLSLAENDIYGVTYIPQKIEILKHKLGIPDELEIAAIIPIGYKADDAKIVRQKTIDIQERIHFNKW